MFSNRYVATIIRLMELALAVMVIIGDKDVERQQMVTDLMSIS